MLDNKHLAFVKALPCFYLELVERSALKHVSAMEGRLALIADYLLNMPAMLCRELKSLGFLTF